MKSTKRWANYFFSAPNNRPKQMAAAIGPRDSSLVNLLKENVTPFSSLGEVPRNFDSFNDCRVLLLGDASHGTSEFYEARAEITKHMIEHHGFNIVAVEADWPDAEAVDRYVRRRPIPQDDTITASRDLPFVRFPTWMWRNQEVRQFTEWLRRYNHGYDSHDAVGFYGLDLYSMGLSMKSIIGYLDKVDPDMAGVARRQYERLLRWSADPHEYGLESLKPEFRGYEKDVLNMLKQLLSKRLEYSALHWNGVEFHSAEQNARLVADAERYYKAMYYGRDESWNLRDTHMFETLARLLKHRGPESKAIVWAHNSHIGDARATSMGWSHGELNIGQLCKSVYGDQALNIGCLTYSGTVAAASRWGGDMRIMKVQPSLESSYENIMHATKIPNFSLDLREGVCDQKLRHQLMNRRLERFIGVIYRPDTERQSHYSTCVLPQQYDGVVWFDRTRHLGVLEVHQPQTDEKFDDTWPFGF